MDTNTTARILANKIMSDSPVIMNRVEALALAVWLIDQGLTLPNAVVPWNPQEFLTNSADFLALYRDGSLVQAVRLLRDAEHDYTGDRGNLAEQVAAVKSVWFSPGWRAQHGPPARYV